MIENKVTHNYRTKPWKTPIDNPIYFAIEILLYRKNKLFLVIKDERSNKKYSIQVNNKVHLRYIPEHYRFSIWNQPEWEKLVQNKFTCAVLESSNFQENIIELKNMPNYFLICDVEMIEIVSYSEPLILPIDDKNIEKIAFDFVDSEGDFYKKDCYSNNIQKSEKKEKQNNGTEFESIIKNAPLHFELLIFSRRSIDFIVMDDALQNRYNITIPFISSFQCIQSPDHSKDYFMINSFIKESNQSVSSLWKLDSSQLQKEEIDLGLFYDEKDFGSLYIKTDNIEIECVTQDPPKISLENRQLLDLIREHLSSKDQR